MLSQHIIQLARWRTNQITESFRRFLAVNVPDQVVVRDKIERVLSEYVRIRSSQSSGENQILTVLYHFESQ